jgi:outer membrane biosynthesis protein TonB
MEAKRTKVPLGGSTLLFIAGAMLLSVVSLVAARATVMDFLEDQGIQTPNLAPVSSEPEWEAPVEPTAIPEPATTEPPPPAPVAEPEPAPTTPATIQSIQQRLTQGSDEIWEHCFAQGLPADAGEGRWMLKVTIAEDGSVATVEVSGPSAEARTCIGTEANRWQFGPLGKQMTVSKQLVYR